MADKGVCHSAGIVASEANQYARKRHLSTEERPVQVNIRRFVRARESGAGLTTPSTGVLSWCLRGPWQLVSPFLACRLRAEARRDRCSGVRPPCTSSTSIGSSAFSPQTFLASTCSKNWESPTGALSLMMRQRATLSAMRPCLPGLGWGSAMPSAGLKPPRGASRPPG